MPAPGRNAKPGEPLWLQQFAATAPPLAAAAAIDAGSGDFVVTGSFSGQLTFGSDQLNASGGGDVFVARFDADGRLRWVERFGGAGSDFGRAAAFAPDGRIVVAGTFDRAMSAGGAALPAPVGRDGFVLTLSAEGDPVSVRALGGTGAVQVNAVAVGADGAVAVAGAFDQALDFGALGALQARGAQDAFVAALSPDGEVRWAVSAGDQAADYARDVAIDADGRVVVTGAFAGSIDVTDRGLQSHDGSQDAFVAAFAPDGAPQWASRFGGGGIDSGDALALGPGGRIFVAGRFDAPARFGDAALEPIGGTDVFLAALDATGAATWAQRFGGGGFDDVDTLASAGESIILAGTFEDRAFFGDTQVVSAGHRDAYALRLTPAGALVWAQRYGGASEDQIAALAGRGDGGAVGAGRVDEASEATDLVVFRLKP